jgi:hypothetical protein
MFLIVLLTQTILLDHLVQLLSVATTELENFALKTDNVWNLLIFDSKPMKRMTLIVILSSAIASSLTYAHRKWRFLEYAFIILNTVRRACLLEFLKTIAFRR